MEREAADVEATPLEELRQPHPEQEQIDAEAAALLRATARPVDKPAKIGSLERSDRPPTERP